MWSKSNKANFELRDGIRAGSTVEKNWNDSNQKTERNSVCYGRIDFVSLIPEICCDVLPNGQ